ncbi:MAG: hypothetical protein ACD_51C00224G0021 [uncultured bacterium]|nr:MAG: hypothetical protein ACD_51C00224G0021 [uncultured bacterium]OGJ48722.1 MAG: hypothetical protein A2244_03440 [Candidatus Peregrinibacteria bacterium RIFOXYA2_FULL_41_18]
MDIFGLFNKDACSLGGKGSIEWTWDEYYKNKDDHVVLVDMINHPVSGSVPVSNELFDGRYPDGTYFVLYCHSGGSSGFLQKKLSPQFPQYHFVNMKGGIGAYSPQ